MNILDMLTQSGELSRVGQQFGLNDAQARAAVEALGPVIGAGISRKAESGGGLADLLGGMVRSDGLGGGSGVDSLTGNGNDILGQIFGSKDVSRGVAQQAAGMSGIPDTLLKKMLPVVASLVMMGMLAKRMFGGGTSSGGGLGDILGSVLSGGGSRQQQPQAGGGGLGDILGDILGGGGATRQQPQPQPGGGGGLGGILGDILSGRAPQGGGTGQGGGLQDMLKDILGGGGLPQEKQEEAVKRGRETIDDAFGRSRNTSGNPADDLLNSVENAIRRR